MKGLLKISISLLLLIGLVGPISAEGENEITTSDLEQNNNVFDVRDIDYYNTQGFSVSNKLNTIAEAINNNDVNSFEYFFPDNDAANYKNLPLSTKTTIIDRTRDILEDGSNLEGVGDVLKKYGFEKIGNATLMNIDVYAENMTNKIVRIGGLIEVDNEVTYTFSLSNKSIIKPNREFGLIYHDLASSSTLAKELWEYIPATVNEKEGTFMFTTNVISNLFLLIYKDVTPTTQTPTNSSCSLKDDKNCDGVVTCDEVNGIGWTWNEDKKACVFIGNNSSNSNVYIVNTSTK